MAFFEEAARPASVRGPVLLAALILLLRVFSSTSGSPFELGPACFPGSASTGEAGCPASGCGCFDSGSGGFCSAVKSPVMSGQSLHKSLMLFLPFGSDLAEISARTQG